MNYIQIVLTGCALSADALSVTVSEAMCRKNARRIYAFVPAAFFGLFQGLMPFGGWLLGAGFSKSLLDSYGGYVACLLLCIVGGKMLFEAFRGGEPKEESALSIVRLLFLSVATSIDAFAVGVSFAAGGIALLGEILIACLIIALSTFVICVAGFFIGQRFGKLLAGKAEIIGGIILIGIGIKMLVETLI